MKTKIYRVSTRFSSLDIIARNKKEAKTLFKQLMKGLVSNSDKITVK